MGNALQLLNWYWWRNRFSIIVMVSFVIVAQVMFWFLASGAQVSQQPVIGAVLAISMLSSAFSAINVFTAGRNLDLTSGKSAFPKWLYSLPISSLKLAIVPVVGIIIAMAWSWVPFAMTMKWVDPSIPTFELIVMPWLCMCAAACWLQAISWRPFKTGWHRLGVVVLAVSVVAILAAIGSVAPSWFLSFTILILAVTGVAAAIQSVGNARYHGWRADLSSLASNFEEGPASASSLLSSFVKLNLKSALIALRWRDWHQIGRIIAALMLLVTSATVLGILFAPQPGKIVLLILVVPAFIMGMVGPALGRDSYFKPQFELPQYLAALPASSRRFLQSRIANSLKTSIAMWLMAIVVTAIWLSISASQVELQRLVEAIEQMFPSRYQSGWPLFNGCVLQTLFLAIVVPFPGLAIGLCGRKNLELTIVCLVGAIGFASIMIACFYGTSLLERLTTPELRNQYVAWVVSWVPYIVVGLLIIKALVTIVSFYIAGMRVPFGWIFDARTLVTGTVVCISVSLFFSFLIPSSVLPVWCTAMIIILLFPCASLVLAYAALDWNRHR